MPHFEMGFFENNWKLFILLSRTQRNIYLLKKKMFLISDCYQGRGS